MPPAEGPGTGPRREDDAVLAALARREEAAFAALLARHHAPLWRLVRGRVSTHALADEVVQETWLAVLHRLERFERRASLRTWIFRIGMNRAKSKGQRESRRVPVSALRDVGEWSAPDRPWQDPERRALALEQRARLRSALGGLPEKQRAVVALRDVEGLSSTEVCRLLAISAGNQRVLLHRGRLRVRRALDDDVAA